MSVDDEPEGYNSSHNLRLERHVVLLDENGESDIMTLTVMDVIMGGGQWKCPQSQLALPKYEEGLRRPLL